jgi:Xaa-Pro aminopeptidase
MSFSTRRQRVRAILDQRALHAVVFCLPQNLRYLCGFSGSDGALVVTRQSVLFLTDSRYTTQAAGEVTADEVRQHNGKVEAVTACLRELGATQIGFEAGLSYGLSHELISRGERDWSWLHLDDELKRLRQLKSADEIACIERAAAINSAAFDEIKELLRPGISEREIALQLEFAMRRHGAEDKAFEIIVASGARGALPHGVASDKHLADAELVTIDFGCRREGYYSDETVTCALGKVAETLRIIYDTALEAHDRAIAAIEPGVNLAEVDRVAREYIREQGFGDYFGHGLGHGVGLDVHEAPVLSPRSEATAQPGMVFTVEPGIYLPGVGGVRIEDMVVVSDSGCRVLTRISKRFRDNLSA